MGCDIHPYIEVNEDRKHPWWRLRSIVRMSRDYTVFGILAHVGSGWLKPISEPKGLPTPEGVDFNKIYEPLYKAWCDDRYKGGPELKQAEQNFAEEMESSMDYDLLKIFLGCHVDYHSSSWLTLAELKAYDWDQEVEVEKMYTLNMEESEKSREQALAAVEKLDEKDPEYANKFDAAFGEWRKDMNTMVKIPLRLVLKRGSREDRTIFAVMEEMERVKPKDGTDDDVRLTFWFDN